MRGGQAIFLKSFPKSRIRKFLGSFLYRKSANFLGVPVRKSQIRNFFMITSYSQICKFPKNTAQLSHKTALRVVFLNRFFLFRTNCNEKKYVLWTCGSFKSANHKNWVRKSKIRKMPHLRMVQKSNKLFKSANLRICDLRNLIAERPSLEK